MNKPDGTEQLHSISADCLDAVLSGERSLTDCLDAYPEHADDLRPLLQTALLTAHLRTPEMPAASVDALEMRLRGQMLTHQPQPTRAPLRPLWRMAAMVAIVVLVLVGGGGGAVAASADSVPGDFLYGLKRLWEAIVLALSPLTGEVDDLWLQIAENRLYEAEALAERGELDDALLNDLYDAIQNMQLLADAGTMPAVLTYTDTARSVLETLQPPPEVEPALNRVWILVQPEPTRVQPSPTPMIAITSTPTATPTLTPTLTLTASPTLTPTSRVSITATPSPTLTPTTPPPTATLTPTLTPTATWTPLPLPQFATNEPVDPRPTQASGSQNNTAEPGSPGPTARFRETQQAIYLTQTAGPPEATPAE